MRTGEDERYRCGAFGTATGEQCVLWSDHDGPHVLPADLASATPPAATPRAAVTLLPLDPADWMVENVLRGFSSSYENGGGMQAVKKAVMDLRRLYYRDTAALAPDAGTR